MKLIIRWTHKENAAPLARKLVAGGQWAVLVLIGAGIGSADEPPPAAMPAGFRKLAISYKAGEEERRRNVFLWYPSAKEAQRHEYFGPSITRWPRMRSRVWRNCVWSRTCTWPRWPPHTRS